MFGESWYISRVEITLENRTNGNEREGRFPHLDDEVNEIRLATAEIVNEEILPVEEKLWGYSFDGSRVSRESVQEASDLRRQIQNKVKERKLWAPHLPPEFGGMGLSFLQHAFMNEVLAYSPGAASLFGVVAPNSGNQKILVKYGSPEQHRKWLIPLTEGRMQSGFSMTEPHNAGSDPRSIQTRAVPDGDEWVINGHKWFTSNGHAADFYIVMCRTADPDDPGGVNDKMTQIIVPKNTPGVNIIRGVPVWGRASSHCEIKYEKRARAEGESTRPHRYRASGGAGSTRRRPRVSLHELGRIDVAHIRPDG